MTPFGTRVRLQANQPMTDESECQDVTILLTGLNSWLRIGRRTMEKRVSIRRSPLWPVDLVCAAAAGNSISAPSTEKCCAINPNMVYFNAWVHAPHPYRCASGTPHETRGNAK
jgi:hypothetical protein